MMIYGAILVLVSIVLTVLSLILLKQAERMLDRSRTMREEATLKIHEVSDRIADLEVVRDEAEALCAKIPMLHEEFPGREILLFATAAKRFLGILEEKDQHAWTERAMKDGGIWDEYQTANKALQDFRKPQRQNKSNN